VLRAAVASEEAVPHESKVEMKLRQLEYALAVRDQGSISAAADTCEVSQPSLSQGLKNLEEELGVSIFERRPSGTEPTRIGRAVLDRAERVTAEANALRDVAASASRDILEGRFRIGVIRTVAPYVLPHVLRPLERAYPGMELEIVEGLTDDLLADVRHRDLDAAIVALPWETPDEMVTFAAFREDFFVVLPPEDPLEEVAEVDIDDLNPRDLLVLDEGHCLRTHALDLCDYSDDQLRGTFRAASLETIREFVAAGWGISLFPATALEREEDVLIRPCATEAYRDIAVLTRSSFSRKPSLEALAEFLEQEVGERARGEHLT